MIKNFEELLKVAKNQKTMRLAVAAAEDEEVLEAVSRASQQGLVHPILIGNIKDIKSLIQKKGLIFEEVSFIGSENLKESAEIAVKQIRKNHADFLMKGLIDTSVLLKAVLDKTLGLRTNSQLSHVMVYEVPTYHKLLYLTDGGMNIAPTAEEKKKITQNAVDIARSMGVDIIKVAALAAKEKVNSKMPATIDAKTLEEAGKSGIFGNNVIVEGPVAFDLAISKQAAKIKRFSSEIAGDVDILVVPDIEMGNGIGKSLTYMAKADSAGVVMGATVPVVLTSRADSAQVKLNSIALGSVIAAHKK